MQNNDLNKIQQNLKQIKTNVYKIQNEKSSQRRFKKLKIRSKRAVEKEIINLKFPTLARIAKDRKVVVWATMSICAVMIIFSTSIFAKSISENSRTQSTNSQENVENFTVEANENVIELEKILLDNVSVLKSKKYIEENRSISFETVYKDNFKLPEGETVVTTPGKNGIKNVKAIKYYENNRYISETILEENVIEEPEKQYEDLGTSKFLGDNKIHIGYKIYLKEEVTLKKEANNESESIYIMPKYLDVVLEELCNEEWCKISYNNTYEGYVETQYLISGEISDEAVEGNRILKIKSSLNKNIALNHSTDLTQEDYRRILSNNSFDRNNVISDNADVFYEIDKKYNINGVFLASVAIHESGWGTSVISKIKKNLFGYGAYDSSPYSSSFSFESYTDGIETLAKSMLKYYLNEPGTEIYDGEIAKGTYYNGNTVEAVNQRYASDSNWSNKVYSYMEYLYNKL